jgi:type IV pilus biogenesis protein PilP
VKVASLEPTAGIASLAALAAEPAPPPRPAGLHAKAASTKAKPKVVTGKKPAAVRAPVAKAKPAATHAPSRVVTVAKPATPARVATVAPLRVAPVAKAAPTRTTARVSPSRQYPSVKLAATPARSARPSSPNAVAAATQRVGVQRGVSLIGIFGSGSGRHALIKMPNGRIQRVAAGDKVAGMQVAAIGADSVQVNSRGRAAILALPD